MKRLRINWDSYAAAANTSTRETSTRARARTESAATFDAVWRVAVFVLQGKELKLGDFAIKRGALRRRGRRVTSVAQGDAFDIARLFVACVGPELTLDLLRRTK
jgi:hypothetical protein